jgi:archaellum component FlaG (FlaF/FlaG flagellin family)
MISKNNSKKKAFGSVVLDTLLRSRSCTSSKKAFGSVVSTLIMFIAIVGVTTGIVISFENYVSETQSSFNSQNELASNKLKTSLSIINTNYNSTSNVLYIYIKNIGESKLRPQNFDVFLNDNYIVNYNVTEASDLSTLLTLLELQDTAAIQIPVVLTSGTHDIKVVSEYGVGDKESFNS